MLFRRIRAPTQQSEEKRCQTRKRCESAHNFPEPTRQRCLRCPRMRQPAQARRAGQLACLVGHAFAAERSAAVGAPCRRFPQRMKQAASIPQARGRASLGGYGWCLRTHSSALQL
jgi:hypothetical protein